MTSDHTPSPELRRAKRIANIEISEILRIGAHAARLKREGRDIIVLGAGEPDFDTPDFVKQAGIAAIEAGKTKYTALDGTLELKAAIARKFERENQLTFAPEEITVSAGAKQILHNALMATVDAGDEVIVTLPCWTSYLDMIRIAEGTPVPVVCQEANGFRVTAAELEAAITPRTRWVMLNSPSNPTGAAYEREHLAALAEVLMRHPHVWIMSDDIYEHLIYDGLAFTTIVNVEPRLRARTLNVNGVSKSYAMTGWRIGYAGGPKALIAAMAVVQSQSTTNPSSISQAAATAALDGDQAFLKERSESFRMRRDLVVDAINAIDGLSCLQPQGAFYAYPNCAGVLGQRTPKGETLHTDSDFCRYLLEEHGVAVVPGSVFGLAPYFRISYASSKEALQRAMQRIAEAVQALIPA